MTFSSSCATAFKFYNFANRTIFKNVLLEAIYRGKVYNSSYLFLVFSKSWAGKWRKLQVCGLCAVHARAPFCERTSRLHLEEESHLWRHSKYGYSTWASFTTLLSLVKPIFEEQDVVIISFINPVVLFLVSASNANRYRLWRPLVVFFGFECILETAL